MRRSTVLFGATIGFGLLYLAGALSLGTPPDANDNGAAVTEWFGHNGGHVRLWLWCTTLALVLFAVFAALMRERLPSPHRDIFFAGAIAFVAETAVQGWIWAGLARHAHQLEPATARTLLDVTSYWGPVLTSTTVMLLAPISVLGLRQQAAVARWVGVVALIAVIEQAVETITIFGNRGFIAPGGPMNLILGAALVAIALGCTGITTALATSNEQAPAQLGAQ